MDFGLFLDVGIFILLIYAILKKTLGYMALKRYEKEGAQVYKNQSKKQMVFQYLCLAFAFIFGGYYAYLLATGAIAFSSGILSPILFAFYLGFLPTSNGYWALTTKGLYLYLYDRFISWPEIIKTGVVKVNDKKEDSPYFLTLIIKKQKSELLKQSQYRCVVPHEDMKMVEDFMQGERKKVDRLLLKKKQGSYREELKKSGRR